jgi:spore coat assembly protein
MVNVMANLYKINGDSTIYEIAEEKEEYVIIKGVNHRKKLQVSKNELVYYKKKESYFDEGVSKELKRSVGEKNSKILLGTVLHIDADQEYLNKTKLLYEEFGVYAYGCLLEENRLEESLTKLKLRFSPDVIVITGHDSYNGKGKKDLNNYINSRFFSKAIRILREKYPNSVIISGACQSNYEALIASGANFASSPQRINVHIYDPAIIAIIVCTTSITRIVNFNKLDKYIKNLKDAFGGVETFGKMKIMY